MVKLKDPKVIFLIKIIIFFLLSYSVYLGYFGFFENISDVEKRFEFVWEFALLGLIVGALITSFNKIDFRGWEGKEFFIYGFSAFLGSLLIIISLGLQGFNYSDSPTQTTNDFVYIGNLLTSIGAIIIFASLIGLLFLSLTKIWRILHNG